MNVCVRAKTRVDGNGDQKKKGTREPVLSTNASKSNTYCHHIHTLLMWAFCSSSNIAKPATKTPPQLTLALSCPHTSSSSSAPNPHAP